MSIFSNDVDLVALKEEMTRIREEVRELKTQNDELRSLIAPAATPRAEETPKIEPEPPIQVAEPQTEASAKGDETVAKALAELTEKVDNNAYQEKMIRELHEELQNYKRGLLEDLAKSYVMDIIKIYERVADTYAHFDIDSPEFSAQKQKKILENNMLSISDMLEDQYSIETYDAVPGDKYQPKEHKAMRSIDTDDAEKAGTVAESISKGFRNYETGKIIRQARVNVYRLNK